MLGETSSSIIRTNRKLLAAAESIIELSPFSNKYRMQSNFTTFNQSNFGLENSSISRMTMMPIQNEAVRNMYFASKHMMKSVERYQENMPIILKSPKKSLDPINTPFKITH